MGRKPCQEKWKKNDLRHKWKIQLLGKKMRKNKPQTNTILILNHFVNLLSLKTSHSDTCSNSLVCSLVTTAELLQGVHYFTHWTMLLCPAWGGGHSWEQGDRGQLAQRWWQGRQEPHHHRALHLPCHHYISLVEGHVQMWDQTLQLQDSCCLAHQLPALPAQAAWGNLGGYSYPIKLVIPK